MSNFNTPQPVLKLLKVKQQFPQTRITWWWFKNCSAKKCHLSQHFSKNSNILGVFIVQSNVSICMLHKKRLVSFCCSSSCWKIRTIDGILCVKWCYRNSELEDVIRKFVHRHWGYIDYMLHPKILPLNGENWWRDCSFLMYSCSL